MAATHPIGIRIRRVTDECFRDGSLFIGHGRVRPGHLLQHETAVIAALFVVLTGQEMAGSRPAMTGWGKSISLNPYILICPDAHGDTPGHVGEREFGPIRGLS
jgi:hypothetical protein